MRLSKAPCGTWLTCEDAVPSKRSAARLAAGGPRDELAPGCAWARGFVKGPHVRRVTFVPPEPKFRCKARHVPNRLQVLLCAGLVLARAPRQPPCGLRKLIRRNAMASSNTNRSMRVGGRAEDGSAASPPSGITSNGNCANDIPPLSNRPSWQRQIRHQRGSGSAPFARRSQSAVSISS
jgi:hypothetical protein